MELRFVLKLIKPTSEHLEARGKGKVESDVHSRCADHIAHCWYEQQKWVEVAIAPYQVVDIFGVVLAVKLR